MVINNDYDIGQIVYLKTDTDQHKRIITALMISSEGMIRYQVACGTTEYWADFCELSTEKNMELV